MKIALEDILLELYFNVDNLNEKRSFKLSIDFDGEAVLFEGNDKVVSINDLDYEIYSSIEVDQHMDELGRLLNNEISSIKFGVSRTNDTIRYVTYYIRIFTDSNDFLFFNNGDEAAYSFDNIDAILANDIYGVEWVDRYPAIK